MTHAHHWTYPDTPEGLAEAKADARTLASAQGKTWRVQRQPTGLIVTGPRGIVKGKLLATVRP
jgi:hypothetical protein